MKKSTKRTILKVVGAIIIVGVIVCVGALIKASVDGITFKEVFTGVKDTAEAGKALIGI